MTYRVYQINDAHHNGHSSTEREEAFLAAAKRFEPEIEDLGLDHREWDYVQIVPMESYRAYWCCNDGAQAWMHRATGYTIPDFCLQSGGQPEMWYRCRRWQKQIKPESPVFAYVLCQ